MKNHRQPDSVPEKNKKIKRIIRAKKPVATAPRNIGDNVAYHQNAKLIAVERRRARSRSITMSVFALFIVFLTVLAVLAIMQKSAPKPQFMFIQKGTIEHTVASTGLIIRDESTINAPANGTVKPLIQEGSRVSYGQSVAVIIEKSSEDSLTALKNCDQQIANLQIELIILGKGPGARVIFDETDKEIAELVNLARKDSMQGLLSNIDSYKSSINVLIDRRDTRLLSIDFKDSRLNELKAQKKELEKKIGLVAGTMTAKSPGIISYQIDGLESALTPKIADTITMEEYNNFIDNYKTILTTDSIVEKNDPILRITSGIYQYIALKLPASSSKNFAVNTFHVIKVPLHGTSIPNCKVIRVVQTKSDLLVIFKTDRQLDRFSDKRVIQTDISVNTSVGMRIPFNSIMNFSAKHMKGEVLLVSGGFTKKANVLIVDYDREYAIIKAVPGEKFGPEISGYLVKNPDSIKEGENIGGT